MIWASLECISHCACYQNSDYGSNRLHNMINIRYRYHLEPFLIQHSIILVYAITWYLNNTPIASGIIIYFHTSLTLLYVNVDWEMHSNDAHIIYYGIMVPDDKITILVECEMKIKGRSYPYHVVYSQTPS